MLLVVVNHVAKAQGRVFEGLPAAAADDAANAGGAQVLLVLDVGLVLCCMGGDGLMTTKDEALESGVLEDLTQCTVAS